VNEKKWCRCYSEKFTILLTIFEHISWKFSLGAGASFYVGLQKKGLGFRGKGLRLGTLADPKNVSRYLIQGRFG
jgi:hypothetical protein